MTTSILPDYLRYWGKTNKHIENNSDAYHLLAYHCLDVAACGYYIIKYGSDSNLLIVFYVQIMPDDLIMQLHRF